MPLATILLLQETFANEVLWVSRIKSWHKMFLNGRELAQFELLGGKPKTVRTINTITTTIDENHHQSVQPLTTELPGRTICGTG